MNKEKLLKVIKIIGLLLDIFNDVFVLECNIIDDEYIEVNSIVKLIDELKVNVIELNK